MHDCREDILLTAYDLNSSFVGIFIELLGELIAAVVVKVGMDVPCGALGDNVGISIAILFALVVLLGVANCLVRNSEISDTGAVNAIISCQRASLLSGFRGR